MVHNSVNQQTAHLNRIKLRKALLKTLLKLFHSKKNFLSLFLGPQVGRDRYSKLAKRRKKRQLNRNLTKQKIVTQKGNTLSCIVSTNILLRPFYPLKILTYHVHFTFFSRTRRARFWLRTIFACAKRAVEQSIHNISVTT